MSLFFFLNNFSFQFIQHAKYQICMMTKKKYNSCKYSIYGKKLSSATHFKINEVFNFQCIISNEAEDSCLNKGLEWMLCLDYNEN